MKQEEIEQREREFFQSAFIEQGDVLSKVIEQRDRLAEACKLFMRVIGDPNASAEDWWATEVEINAAWNSGNAALAAVEGGSDE